MKAKLALGTAQFGLNYGINNKRGLIPQKEACRILWDSVRSGIDTVDTAKVYGRSEKVIGLFIKQSGKNLKIISKLPKCKQTEVPMIVKDSLRMLETKRLYGYLIHDFKDFMKNPGIWGQLRKQKKENKIKKIGFSLYFPEELGYILKKGFDIDLVQVPFSIFDQRFTPYLSDLDKRGIEVHTRSIFLQGLVFKNPTSLKGSFLKIKPKLLELNDISRKTNIPLAALCLNFTLLNKFVDKVVVGVDSLRNFKEIIEALDYSRKVESLLNSLFVFKETDENIILPFRWKAA